MRAFANALLAEFGKASALPAAWAGGAVALLGSAAITVLNAFTVRRAVLAGTHERVFGTSPFETGFTAMPIVGVGKIPRPSVSL